MTQYSPDFLTLNIVQRLPVRRLEPEDNIVQRKEIGIELHVHGDPVEIGRMELAVVDFSVLQAENESLFAVCDSYSQPLLDWAMAVFSKRENFKPAAAQALEVDMIGTATAYVDTLFIEPAYRGSKLGLAALHALLRYGCLGCGTVFLKAYPFVGEGVPCPAGAELNKGRLKLRELYAALGFTRIGKTDYMGINLDYALPDFPQ